MQPDFWIDFVIPMCAIMGVFGGLSLLADLLGRINWNYFQDRRRTSIEKALANQYSPEKLAELRVIARHMSIVNGDTWDRR
jgi:hypothetical protein